LKKNSIIILVLFLLALAIGVFSYYELVESRNDLMSMTKSESKNLISALKYSIENNLYAIEIIYEEILNSLVSTASLAYNINEKSKFDDNSIKDFAKTYDLDLIIIKNKKTFLTNIRNVASFEPNPELSDELDEVNKSKIFWQELGINEIWNKNYYIVAGYFNHSENLIIVGLNEEKLLNLRKNIGIGKLLKNFATNQEIIYTVLQDSMGIIAASNKISQLKSIQNDTFLLNAYYHNHIIARKIEYENKMILESAIKIENLDVDMILRLGVSLDKVKQINQRNTIRTIFLGIGLLIIIIGATAFVYQRASHQKLKETHQQMLDYTGVLLSNINEGVVGIDNLGKIILYNQKAEFLFGKIIDKADYETVFPNDLLNLKSTLNAGQLLPYSEIEFKNHLDNKLILAYSTSIVKDTSGNPDIAIAVVRDITQIKLSEGIEKRNEKLTATGLLAAGVAHEIRNPMNSIYIIAQRLELEFEPENDKEDYFTLISTVRREIKRIDNIISQFLDFSKVSRSKLQKNNLVDVLKKSLNLVNSSAIQKNIQIINEIKNEIILPFDPDKIEQVFINLLQNSIDAIPLNGVIQIELETDSEAIRVKIIDNGTGIPDEIKSKIFDLYFTTKSFGTGLGLGIANKIMEEHNGRLYFDTNNQGTTFTMEFKR
jgi:signal transduction histidine kinase